MQKARFILEGRITTWHEAQGELAQVFSQWGEYIQSETLTTQLKRGAFPEGAYAEEFELEGEQLMLAVKQNKK